VSRISNGGKTGRAEGVMGQEATCVLRTGRATHAGKTLLESNEIIFRSDSFRLRIPFAKMKSVNAKGGELRVETPDGSVVFVLCDFAEKCAHKILHPKSRIEKLGVKPSANIVLIGKFAPDFKKELKSAAAKTSTTFDGIPPECIFLALETRTDLRYVAAAAKQLAGASALWMVYPKGKKEITEVEVISAGRKAGLKDVKVVGFSPTHTALKFVLPLGSRRQP
jgi:hypothetical protein